MPYSLHHHVQQKSPTAEDTLQLIEILAELFLLNNLIDIFDVTTSFQYENNKPRLSFIRWIHETAVFFSDVRQRIVRFQINQRCFVPLFFFSCIWGLNYVVNLVLLSDTTIWNDSFRSVLSAIFSKISRSIFYTLKYILVWFWYIEIVQSSSILSAILFTAEINYYKTVRFFPDSYTQVSKFVFWHVAAYVVVVNVINLWSPYVIGQSIYIFMLWFVLLLVFLFLRLISAAADWMSAILPHMVWP